MYNDTNAKDFGISVFNIYWVDDFLPIRVWSNKPTNNRVMAKQFQTCSRTATTTTSITSTTTITAKTSLTAAAAAATSCETLVMMFSLQRQRRAGRRRCASATDKAWHNVSRCETFQCVYLFQLPRIPSSLSFSDILADRECGLSRRENVYDGEQTHTTVRERGEREKKKKHGLDWMKGLDSHVWDKLKKRQ